MVKKKKETIEFDKIALDVKTLNIKEFIEKNYLPYAHYTILDRALVSQDGLKPVHKRLLWTLWTKKLKHKAQKVKANTIYGDVIGRFHPHGPSSVSNAGARLGQSYTLRVPLIEVQGSVGFATGDKPLADRYYEIALSKAGELLLEDADDNGATMIPNYSNTETIPEQLPVKWPVALINGSDGIAVGYASKMFPHNPTEVMDAVIARLQGKLKTHKQLFKYMKGPDFPTGGELLGLDGVKSYFETGEGKFFIRSKYYIEDLGRGRHNIVFYELPYQIPISHVQNQIKKAKDKDKLKDVSEHKDLTDQDNGVKFVVTTKAGANPQIVLDELFNNTDLQSSFSANNTLLINKRPVKADILTIIDEFIQLRKEVFERKTDYKISVLNKRYNRLTGIIKVLVDVDKAIEIIKNSKEDKEALTSLMKSFEITEEQAQYILSIQLRSLTRQNSEKLLLEKEEIKKELERLTAIIQDEDLFEKAIIDELKATKKIISSDRKTTITEVTNEDLNNEAKKNATLEKTLNKNVDVNIYKLANNSFVKTIGESTFKIPIKSKLETTSKTNLFSLTEKSELKEISIDNILLNKETSFNSLGLKENETILLLDKELNDNETLLVVSNYGNVNRVKDLNKTPAIKLLMGEKIIFAEVINSEKEDKDLNILAEDGTIAKMPVSKIPTRGSGSGTVAGMKTDKVVVSAALSYDNEYFITKSNKTIKVTPSSEVKTKSRGTKGMSLHKVDSDEKLEEIYSTQDVMILLNKKPFAITETNKAKKGTPFKGDLLIGSFERKEQ